MFGRLTKVQRIRRRVEDALTGLGLTEIYTPSLREADTDPNALRLPEPITVELAELRTTLVPSLVEAAARNAELGAESIALFEIARVYRPAGGPLPDEHTVVAGILQGDFTRAKGTVEAIHAAVQAPLRINAETHPLLHPGKAAKLEAGWVGELDPRLLEGTWGVFELDLDVLAAASVEPVPFEDVITFPALRQDIALVVDEGVPAGELVAAAQGAVPEVRSARVFDVYRGEQVPAGRKSVALALEFRSAEKTLTDEDAAPLRNRVVDALRERFGAELRT
jgi:phenylalanyl-tRNA synthetase beta chain